MTSPLRLYTDAHIAKAAIDQLSARGVDIIRCQDVGMADVDDLPHLEYATREGRALVTGDRDFLRLDAEWRKAGRRHAGIFYVHPRIRGLGERGIGVIVKTLFFWHEAVIAEAANVEKDVYNQVTHIT